MLRFDHSKFALPDFEAVSVPVGDDGSDVERTERLFRGFASQAPAGLDGQLVTPARLCWVVLWSRTVNLGLAVASALAQDDRYTMQILARPLNELQLHMQAITTSPEPVAIGSKKYWHGVVDRLHGFLAWCLKSDKEFYERAGSRGFMDLMWDPQPVHDIVTDPKQAAFHEVLGTPLEVLNEHEIEIERAKSEEYVLGKVAELRALLGDRRLTTWASRFEQLRRKGNGPSFYSLLSQEHTSLNAEFKAIGVRLGSLNYGKASALLHGQTALQFIECSENSVLAAIGVFDRDHMLGQARNMFSYCNQALVVLHLMKDHCLELKGPAK